MGGCPVQEDIVPRMLLRAIQEKDAEMVWCMIKEYEHEHLDSEIFRWAVSSFSIPIMKALLKRYPKMVNHDYEYLGTPLMIACMGQAPLVFVRFLLESGADVNRVPATVDYTAIQQAATAYRDLGQCIETIKVLFCAGASIDGDVLAWAASHGRVPVMHYLLIMGAPHERDPVRMQRFRPRQQLALHAAAQEGYYAVVVELLIHSVNINSKNGQNLTAMTVAWGNERAERDRAKVRFLLGIWEQRKRDDDLARVIK